jgi:hypothetical protein
MIRVLVSEAKPELWEVLKDLALIPRFLADLERVDPSEVIIGRGHGMLLYQRKDGGTTLMLAHIFFAARMRLIS